jgi:mannose-6-phosphate isomerase
LRRRLWRRLFHKRAFETLQIRPADAVILYPLTFQPRFKERLWGNRALETLYHKALPANLPIGESWEIADRPGDVSVIDRGPLAGRDLHWVVQNHARELMGSVPLLNGRFPLLAKILDAREKLSLQVHPPASVAAELRGEPKTEMWYLAHAEPGAELYVGLKRGVARQDFEERLQTGTVAGCFHRVPVHAGDAMFVPSGRVHAVGTGCVIFEIQQNSDSTYRVFDWNRVGPDGQPRELHIRQSLQSIDFNDFEPGLVPGQFRGAPGAQVRPLVSCPYFEVELRRVQDGVETKFGGVPVIVAVTRGELEANDESGRVVLAPGQFCLLPAGLEAAVLRAKTAAEFLVVQPK